MTKLCIFFSRWLTLFRKAKLEHELDEEIRSHLELQVEENLRRGMNPVEAQNAAFTIVVRGRVPLDHLVTLARRAIWSVDQDLALTDITPLPQLIRASAGDQRFRTSLLSTFAGSALFLAALGVYGVLSYSVTRRLREMGIRRALGAPHRSLYWIVVRDGMRPVLMGSIIGLAVAFAATRLIVSLLFGVTPADPITYLLTTVTLIATSLVACSIPALKAVSVDPMVVLRYE